LTRQQLSSAYKEARDRGDFVPHLREKVAPCKTDIFKLCAWRMKRRSPLMIDLDWRKLKSNAAKSLLDKPVAAFIEQETNGPDQVEGFRRAFSRLGWTKPPPGIPLGEVKEMITDRLGRRELTVQKYIGGGISGSVFRVERREADGNIAKAVVKIVRIRHDGEWTTFIREVDKQRQFAELLDDHLETKTLRVPTVHKMWKLPGGMEAAVLMESIDGSLGSFVRRYRDNPSFLLEIARQLKRTVASLRRKKVVHGDLRYENIGYKLLPNDRPEIYIIDFGRSVGPLTATRFERVADIDRRSESSLHERHVRRSIQQGAA
jgi:tRNA A-37 threonylcarbamoyl transferase component Bud32